MDVDADPVPTTTALPLLSTYLPSFGTCVGVLLMVLQRRPTPHTPPRSPLPHRHQNAPGTIGATATLEESRAELLYTLTEPATVDIRHNPTRNATPRVVKCRH